MSADYFSCFDPCTGEKTGTYPYATRSELIATLKSLHTGFSQWKKTNLIERQEFFVRLSQEIEAKRSELAAVITAEMGKPLTDSVAEVNKCIKTLHRLRELPLSSLEPRELRVGLSLATVRAEPLGVIYGIMPWNYPLWQVVRMTLPALLSGNVVLLKHSDLMPRLAHLIEQIFSNAAPDLSLLLHRHISHELTDFILSRSEIGGVSLTGSVRAGREVYQIAARHLKKCVLELGGSDPYIVLSDADLKKAASKIIKSRLLNNGQSCISAKRALVHSSVLPKFLDLIKTEIDSYTVGVPTDPSVQLGPLAHPQFKNNIKRQRQEFLAESQAELVIQKAVQHNFSEEASFVDVEVYLLKQRTNWLKSQEFFGPILIVIPFESDEEAVELANDADFGLGAAVFSENLVRAELVASQIIAGQVAINDLIFTDLLLPFGGFKSSGIGRELGAESLTEFTQTKVLTRPYRSTLHG